TLHFSLSGKAIPILASTASFVLYAALGQQLDATIIFPALAFYTSMRAQMNNWPNGLSAVTDTLISIRRIEDFLLTEEIQSLPETDPSCPWAIEIQDGCFYWDRIQGPDEGTTEKEKLNRMHSDDNEDKGSADSYRSQILVKDSDATRLIFLRDIQLQIPRGALVAVIGAVGHGKSSLLQAMVGNMPMQSGRLVRGAATTFAAQQPWIQNATVRDNILFGVPYDAVRYNRVIRVCQLERDLANLPRGDFTELGERGINLSGGQKARVSLARAVYFQSEDVSGELSHGGGSCSNCDSPEKAAENRTTPSTTVIMDDPLAAVDAHVGKRLWRDCIMTELQGRTRIVATHQLHVLPDVDLIVCMKDGRIDQIGSYQELMEDPSHDAFRALIARYGGATVATATAELCHDETRRKDQKTTNGETAPSKDKEAIVEDHTCPSKDNDNCFSTTTPTTATSTSSTTSLATSDNTKPNLEAAGKQIVKEERKYGAITLQSYRRFFYAIGSAFWCGVFSAYVLQQAASVMMNLWLSFWTYDKYHLSRWKYIVIYLGLVIGQMLLFYLASAMLAISVAKTGEVLHRDALVSVLRARMVFFETTPLGRILTRFSKDVDSIDDTLHSFMNDYFACVFSLLGILALLIIVIPWMILVVPPLGGLYYFLSIFSRSTTRELKRLDSVKRADMVSFQSASLAGIETMRAFEGSMARCIAQSRAKQDASNSPNFAIQHSTRWTGMNGMMVGNLTTFVAALIVIASRYSIMTGEAGLVLSYLIQVGLLLNWTLQRYTNMEMAMNSAERLDEYIHTLDHEEEEDSLSSCFSSASVVPSIRKADSVDPEWPQHGHIRFTNVWMRYRPELPWSLENVTFDIKAGEKVGVVGRTGAGKSSLIQVLFRLVEIESSPEAVGVRDENGDEGDGEKAVTGTAVEEAAILVDGQRIDQLTLADLRSRMAIIPQDPTLFEGSIRFNLDPLSRFSDDELWRALEMAELKSYVQDQEGGLEALVAAHGENLSVGQRQLVCLARALLIKSKVVVLDEATASVDLATDTLIQRAIRVDLAGSTVVTIAHRLNTVIDFDKVLVLDRGQVVEFDSPHALLNRPGSLFCQLVDETGEQSATMLRILAANQVSV
ncbi:Canalicular multispecific organic anion transporter 1, partial [Actinomortierella ambigua]